MRAVRRARGSQLLASASVMRSTGPPSRETWPLRLPVGPPRPNHDPQDPLMVLRGRPPLTGASLVSSCPSGGARHQRAGSPSPCWSLSRPNSATHTPSPPGGGPRSSGGPGPRPSPGLRAGPPLPPAPALPAAPMPAAPAPRPVPPPPGEAAIRAGSALGSGAGGGGGAVVGVWGVGGGCPRVRVDVVEVRVVVVVALGVVRGHLLDARGG